MSGAVPPSRTVVIQAKKGGLTSLKIEGIINETFDPKAVLAGLGDDRSPIVINLDSVRTASSFGIRQWTSFLGNLAANYYCFTNCRPGIVSQFNMVAGFAGRGQIISFFLPYHCQRCSADFERLTDLRRTHEAMSRFEVAAEQCPSCGSSAELDDLPQVYLQYIASQRPPSPPLAIIAELDGLPAPLQIDKTIEGVLTILWMRGILDSSTRLGRLAEGLDGVVLVIAMDVEAVTPEGAAAFSRFLTKSQGELFLGRLPLSLAANIQISDTERIRLVSVRLPFACTKCSHGALVDIEQSQVLTAGQSPPSLACPSCQAHTFQPTLEDWAKVAALPLVSPPLGIGDYLSRHPQRPLFKPEEAGRLWAASDPGSLGKYQLLSRIGLGGMAEVFLARQVGPEGFSKKVVLKRILPQLSAEAQFVKMFFDEARIAARVSHPNVVQIFEIGRSGDDYFLAIEYVNGADLNTILRLCRDLGVQMPPELACRIIADVCAGLHAAHVAQDDDGQPLGIVHRDVSPHNILISQEGMVKLTDFGIAKASYSSSATRPGTLKGKLGYMAPEQIEQAEALDARADIFSAGVVLYHCLTLEQLFRRESYVETMRAVTSALVTPIRRLRPDVTADLEAKLQRALARSPTRRYQTAQEFQLALEESITLMGRPATATQLSRWLLDVLARGAHLGLLHSQGTDGFTPSPTDSQERGGPMPPSVMDSTEATRSMGPVLSSPFSPEDDS